MKLLYTLKDNEFPFKGIDNKRDISRGVIYNDNNQIALIHLLGDDMFGHRDYLETPGGGKDKNETFKEALIREIKEELGASIDNIKEIGRVKDYYNLLKRENNNHYYLAHLVSINEDTNLCNYEKRLFHEIKWIDIDEIDEVYKNIKRTPISNLVINRELKILQLARKMIKEKQIDNKR